MTITPLPSAEYNEEGHFTGHTPRECHDHYSTGGRAWCDDDTEWCYPAVPCARCEIPMLRVKAEWAEQHGYDDEESNS